MTPEEMRQAIVEAFKAGADWCTKNGADRWCELSYDAEFYSHTKVVLNHGGLVVFRPNKLPWRY